LIAKRATALVDAGLTNLEVHRGLYGFSVHDRTLVSQRAIVHKTSDQAVAAALAGERPLPLEKPEFLTYTDSQGGEHAEF